MNSTDLNNLVAFDDSGPAKSVFHDAGGIKAQVMCLKAGQEIPPCKMGNDVLFFVIRGEGEMVVDKDREDLKPMVSVVVPRQAESRSIHAKTDMVILAVQSLHLKV
jgi:quercetin dioxygenase-like cupin family protein